jgi:hypothetical protein
MHGLMRSEGLLGFLPKSYEAAVLIPTKKHSCLGFPNRETDEWHLDDPRLGQLPKGWAKHIHRHRYLFVNEQTGEKTRFDPRMTVED